jgi:putative inorganic carbon (HCO3(-)) transporter
MAYGLAAAAAVLAISVRPALATPGSRCLDAALLLSVVVVAASLVPLPPAFRFALSPSTRIIDLTLRLGDSAASSVAARPLSIDPAAGRVSLALAAAMLLLFLSARAVFARGGVRLCVRAIAGLGLVLAAIGMAQHATAPRLLYWTFPTRSATPFGPYMNHSDFATWLVMALPLTAGYLIARLQSRRAHGGFPAAIAEAFDNTAMWLTTAIGFMAAGLVVGLSRSGLIAAGAGLGAVWLVSAARMQQRGRAWLLAGFGVIALVAAAYANTNAISARVDETIRLGLGGRSAIWRETLPMISDFWLTGVGPGGYERGMIVYQQSPRVVYFNHAHNEYLQIAAEGGLLLTLPALVIAVAGAWRARRSLGADRTPIYWVRAGAVGGLVAVAVQSLWETGLRVPANGLLFAVVAAIAIHDQE